MKMRKIFKIIKKILPQNFIRFIQQHRVILIYLLQNRAAQKQKHLKTPWVCVLPYDPNKSLHYLNEVYHDYFVYSHIPVSFVKGKRILEVGPGENLGVGMRFLADGAAFVASVDRFSSLRSAAEQAAVYLKLIETFTESQRSTFGNAIAFTPDGYTIDESRYRYLSNTAMEGVGNTHALGTFDMIVSRAVLEHVYDLEGVFHSMDSLLKHGGYMVHEIDFRDHGIFTNFGLNPLTYLTINNKLWKAPYPAL